MEKTLFVLTLNLPDKEEVELLVRAYGRSQAVGHVLKCAKASADDVAEIGSDKIIEAE